MKEVDTRNAVGHVLCHDLTKIVRGEAKGPAFRKGHIIAEDDIPILLSMGKEHLYVWEKAEGVLHEDDAAAILCELAAGENIIGKESKEGKIDLYVTCDGLLTIDVNKLNKLNSLGEMMIATRRHNMPVKTGDHVAGTRVIPLLIETEKMDVARQTVGSEPLLTIHPFKKKKIGIVVTGSEVEKLAYYDSTVLFKKLSGDDTHRITENILEMIENGADMVLCTGGMSVDPDDKTPLAIKNTGARVVSYGAPVLPGAMFMLSYTNENIPIVGLPGCVMYAKKTIFDIILPRLLADVAVTEDDIHVLGNGGLCLNCTTCVFPICSFGMGN